MGGIPVMRARPSREVLLGYCHCLGPEKGAHPTASVRDPALCCISSVRAGLT
jgi:hypothetical protein